MKNSRWEPIADRQLADRAADAIESIARALRDSAPPTGDLGCGALGVALFHAYYAMVFDRPEAADLANRLVERSMEPLEDGRSVHALYGGAVGVGWMINHLTNGDSGDSCAELDVALEELLCSPSWARDWDLLTGLAGIAVYELERTPSPASALALERICHHLDRDARCNGWVTRPELIHPSERYMTPDGCYNLGLAHGIPGAIAAVARTCLERPAPGLARDLLRDSVDCMLARRRTGDAEGCSAGKLRPGESPDAVEPARPTWCYGDPGVAAALLWAARACDEPAWEHAALAVARSAATRRPETAGVVDAGLCHGAIGLAHLFNRFHQATGESLFRASATEWMARGLDMRRPGVGVAGFQAWRRGWIADPGFLTGAAGIGLALISFIAPIEPDWDRCMLVNLPAPGANRAGACSNRPGAAAATT